MKKKFPAMLLCFFLLEGLYNLWTLRPVNVQYVYSDAGSTVDLVVDHLPWTDRDKIAWYLTRRDEFKKKYPLLEWTSNSYYIIDIGKGFIKFEGNPSEDLRYENLICFPTIKSDMNCVVKNYLLIVDENPDSNTLFYMFSEFGSQIVYQLTPEGKIEFIPQPETSME